MNKEEGTNVLNVTTDFDKRIAGLTKLHGIVLGTWAFLNMCTGIILFMFCSGVSSFFGIMNSSWGLINGGMAIFVYYHNRRCIQKPKSLLNQLDRQRHVEKVLLLNIGLDAAYALGGVAMWQHSLINEIGYAELWKGFGFSVIVQGCFLFFQDYFFYLSHASNRNDAYSKWEQMMKGL